MGTETPAAGGTRVFLSLGSNLGDRRAHLRNAVDSLPGVVAVSPVYETDPVGGPAQDQFLNIVVELTTEMTPGELLGLCHRVEAAAERVREQRWGPRTLDVDIIWMDGVEMETERLTIPHPRWRDRRFVLAPLRDLAPELVSETDLRVAHGSVLRSGPL
ncbi:MAG: 2-amino-4-hydroxy-6-hydroxymethyldihydropteridine diphosphokinase [Microthrixaceae bacterium]|nr:2-amino-4-hydroxy-6-hydroxymethyldihydropteridine diphosphokinase [Microthrixaceae bacterium]